MKSIEELNQLKEECKEFTNKMKELSDDELKYICGGNENRELVYEVEKAIGVVLGLYKSDIFFEDNNLKANKEYIK